jgi:hypothetical protein
VIKSGYLNKQGKGFMGGWNRRWFVLDSSGAPLRWAVAWRGVL